MTGISAATPTAGPRDTGPALLPFAEAALDVEALAGMAFSEAERCADADCLARLRQLLHSRDTLGAILATGMRATADRDAAGEVSDLALVFLGSPEPADFITALDARLPVLGPEIAYALSLGAGGLVLSTGWPPTQSYAGLRCAGAVSAHARAAVVERAQRQLHKLETANFGTLSPRMHPDPADAGIAAPA